MNDSKRTAARRRLDQRFPDFKPESRFLAPPKGWIRAIRDALGMSAAQLGHRIGVKPQSMAGIEGSERHGTIRLSTLRRVAEALDCTVIYALVPNSSLEDMVQDRARTIARQALDRVGHSMGLEGQGVSPTQREAQIDAYISEHLRERDLWEV